MKKLLFLVTMLVCSMAAHAGLDVDLKSGSLKPLKAGGTAVVVFDFSEAKWDKDEPLSDHYSNLDELARQSPAEFARKFRKIAKNVELVKDELDAKWKFLVKVENMDSYYNVMGWGLPGHVTKVEGVIAVIDLESNEQIALIDIDEVDGGRNVDISGSFRDCMEALGEQVGELVKKGK